ncbi:hypothetical protein Tco_0434875 [Tanacetum coccineum]
MSLGLSDVIDIPDAELAKHAAEAAVLPKFDMHLHTLSLDKTHVKWITQVYNILVDLHPLVAPEWMTMADLPDDVIGLYLHCDNR